jgi:M6 family metalloprotease-like protein
MRKPARQLLCVLLALLAILSGAIVVSATPAGSPVGQPAVPPIMHAIRPQAPGNPMPSKGDQKLLVVLADFPDRAGLFTGQAWRQVFFGADGFADYYKEVSYNQLRYTGDIVGISGATSITNSNTVAYVRLPHPITFYADGQYGFKVGAGQFPRNNGGVVRDALQALDTAGFDFAPYADPSTHKVENLVVVFAGSTYAYTQDAVNSLEATGFSLTFAGGETYISSGGQTFDNYTFCPDQRFNLGGTIAFIGICAHEHGHSLGLPDLYDFSYTTSGDGNFDIMAYGTYGSTSGERPYHFGAFTKEYLGWVTPSVVASGTTTVTLAPAESSPSVIKLYPWGNTSGPEYFLLENRRPIGFDQDWLGGGLCAGLVIWHIDQDMIESTFFLNRINTLASAGGPPHQGVVVVEADNGFDMIAPPLNYGECTDTWAVGRTWNAGSSPSSSLWDGGPSKLSVRVVSENQGTLTLSITISPSRKVYLPSVVSGASGKSLAHYRVGGVLWRAMALPLR